MNPSVPSAVRLSSHTVSRELGGDIIALDARVGRYFRLEGSAAAIWTLLPDHPRVDDLTDALAARHDRRPSELAADVRTFVREAVDDGLLEEDETSSRTEPPSPAGPVRIERTRLVINRPVADCTEAFDRQHFIHLSDLLEPTLLMVVETLVSQGPFVDRTHDGIGTELCLQPGIATSVLQLLFNDPALRAFAAQVGGHQSVGCYDGRVYRLSPQEGHYDSWHSDAGEDRLIAVSLNLSPAGYEGGELELRHASSAAAEWTVRSGGFGSAVMFRISPTLRHRVIAVRGTRPRTAWAGWFRSTPVFEELFLPTLRVD